MPNGNDTPQNIEAAMSQALTKLLARKVAIICFAIYAVWGIAQLVIQTTEPMIRYCLVALAGMVCVLAIVGFVGQMSLDKYEIAKTGKDQPDNNGNGGPETPEAVKP